MKRMFHPSLNSWVDVPDKDVESWAESGWLKEQPGHVEITPDVPPPGETPGIAAVPVEPDPVVPEPPADNSSDD